MSEELNENQTNQRGGKREGAGRKKGSTKKPQISDFITEEEVKDLVAMAKEQATTKPELLRFLLEQVFGKARQAIELSGGEEPITFEIRTKANQSIKEFLNGNSEDTTKRQQGDDKGSFPIQSEPY